MPDAFPPPPRSSAGPAPLRRPGSLRRTSSIEISWPDGRAGEMHMIGRARDVVTPSAGGAPALLGQDAFTARLRHDRTIVAIAADPPRPELSRLVGVRGGGGLRKSLDAILPHERDHATPLYLILDDMAGASLVSSWAWSQWDPDWLNASRSLFDETELAKLMAARTDVCIGLAAGSSAFAPNKDRSGAPAAELRNPQDPEGWHAFTEQQGAALRRARRIDLSLGETILIEAAFQDSATTPQGGRAAVHEYLLEVTADPQTLEVLTVKADPRVLPHAECPAAVNNIGRLIGTPLADLRERVAVELRKTAGCTHLNDAFRALADAPALAERLRRALAASG